MVFTKDERDILIKLRNFLNRHNIDIEAKSIKLTSNKTGATLRLAQLFTDSDLDYRQLGFQESMKIPSNTNPCHLTTKKGTIIEYDI